MRIVVFSPLVPAIGGSGGQTRELHLLRRLVELGHTVDVVCPVPAGQRELVDTALAVGIGVHGPVRPASRSREVLEAMASRPGLAGHAFSMPLLPWQLEVLWQGMRDAADLQLSREPDVAVVVWDLAAAWRKHLPADLPVAIDLHDATWAYRAIRAQQANGASGVALAVDARRTRRFAARWLPRYDEVLCVSEVDAQRIQEIYPSAEPQVVANGVDLDAFVPSPEVDGPPTVLFTGTMNYRPNSDGALWLANAVWPLVRRAAPNARLFIVGREPPSALQDVSGVNGIEVTGGVPSMQPFFAAAHVVAAPLLSGGGTRLKILEAAAAGRAIVSTTRGAEGLSLRPGSEILIADRAEEFAAGVLRLLDAPTQRTSLATAARAVVESNYGWDAQGDKLEAVLANAISTSG